jgi:hypothetical protein
MEFTDLSKIEIELPCEYVEENEECEGDYIPYKADASDKLEFSAYHYHHNREPFYVLFIKKEDMIYIEMINDGTHRNKNTNEIVMPFEEMVKNKSLKKYYDMSVMLVNDNNTKRVYYDKRGKKTKYLIQTYDTESDTDEECEEAIPIRHWCICADIIWKGMRVSKSTHYSDIKCYYNINPFTFEYKVDTEKQIASFTRSINAFAEYHNVGTFIETAIIANYNEKCQSRPLSNPV